MKIIMSATGSTLSSDLDPRFGRCAYFAVLDTQSGALEAVPNPFLEAAGGAGTQAAQWVLDQEADLLITGRCGPKAAAVLDDAGIRIVEGASGTLREASAPYADAAESDAERAPAIASDPKASAASETRAGAGFGRGRGRGECRGGEGRGPGGGRGAGRGLGRRGRG